MPDGEWLNRLPNPSFGSGGKPSMEGWSCSDARGALTKQYCKAVIHAPDVAAASCQ
jgi:hypothetical protein